MTTVLSQQQQLDRAARAKTLLDDDILRGAFVAVREGYVAEWLSSPPGERDLELKIAVSVIQDVEAKLRRWISDAALLERKR